MLKRPFIANCHRHRQQRENVIRHLLAGSGHLATHRMLVVRAPSQSTEQINTVHRMGNVTIMSQSQRSQFVSSVGVKISSCSQESHVARSVLQR
jgi:hypothetical protein